MVLLKMVVLDCIVAVPSASIGAVAFGLSPGMILVGIAVGIFAVSQGVSLWRWMRRSSVIRMAGKVIEVSDRVLGG